jgi:hypothetical protein
MNRELANRLVTSLVDDLIADLSALHDVFPELELLGHFYILSKGAHAEVKSWSTVSGTTGGVSASPNSAGTSGPKESTT